MTTAQIYKVDGHKGLGNAGKTLYNKPDVLRVKVPKESLHVFDKKDCVILCGADQTIKILNSTIDNNKKTCKVKPLMSIPYDDSLIGEYEIEEIDNGLLLLKI